MKKFALVSLFASLYAQTFDYENVDEHSEDVDSEEIRQRNAMELESMINLKPTEVERRLGHVFKLIDTNDDLVASKRELISFLKSINKKMDSNLEKDILQMFDHDQDGYVSFDEAQTIMVPLNERNDDSIAHFKRRIVLCDTNKDGRLDATEATYIMQPFKIPALVDLDSSEFFENLDADKNGMISFAEFRVNANDEDEKVSEDLFEEFQSIDKDGSGTLDLGEVKTWLVDISAAPLRQRDEAMEAVNKWMDHFAPEGLSEDDFPSRVTQLIIQRAPAYGDIISSPWVVGLKIPGLEVEEKEFLSLRNKVDSATHELRSMLEKEGLTIEDMIQSLGLESAVESMLRNRFGFGDVEGGNLDDEEIEKMATEALSKKLQESLAQSGKTIEDLHMNINKMREEEGNESITEERDEL